MDFLWNEEQEQIRDAVERACAPFDADYWLRKDHEGDFPHDFHKALADAGWLGIAMPEEFGGAGLGISEAALMMHTISATGAGLSGASAVHMNIFGLHPVVVFGTDEQKRRWLPPLIAGTDKACFGVTEPNAGLNTLKLQTRAVRDGDVYVVHGQKVFISTAQVANKILLLVRTKPVEECTGTEGLSLFYTDLGLGRAALARATQYAKERVVFDRPIGQNQGIQHPLAQAWMGLEAAHLMVQKAAFLYDRGLPCGAEANAAKYLAAEACAKACETAIFTHGGMGYAKEYHVERYMRESWIPRLAPVSPQLIMCFIAEKVLGLPKSY